MREYLRRLPTPTVRWHCSGSWPTAADVNAPRHPLGAVGFVRWAGALVATAGIVATLWAQGAMGDSWRVGVDPDETTGLVTSGRSPSCGTRSSPR